MRESHALGPALPARALVAVGMVAAAACLLPFAGTRLEPWPFFLPAFLTAVVVLDGLTSFLLVQQYLIRGGGRLLALAITYLFSALVVVPHAMTFPGVVAAAPLFGAAPATTMWLWAAWHAGFPAGLLVAAAPWPRTRLGLDAGARRQAVLVATLLVVAVVAALTSFLVADASALPPVISGTDYTGLTRAVAAPLVALDVVAVAVVAWGGRRGEPVQRWLPVAALATLIDAALVLAAQNRWSLGWYAGRVMSTVAAAVILGVLLHQVTVLYRRLWDAHERLLEESRHDYLTTLLNRRAGFHQLAQLLQQAGRHRFPVSVAVLDVDHFKLFNDTHGHAVGDRVLEEVAARVRASLRAGDFAFRMGGEEFGVVFSHASEEEALEGAWRILRVIRSRPVRTEDGPVTVTASVGVAEAAPQEAVSEVVERADRALYEAKRSGRDRVRGHSRLVIVESEG